MRVVTKQELESMPEGVLFSEWRDGEVYGGLHIKVVNRLFKEFGWVGELIVDKPFIATDNSDNSIFYTSWAATDNTDASYEDNQLFVLWNKNEIESMINCLKLALLYATEPKTKFNTFVDVNHWIAPDGKLLTDKEVRERTL